MPDLDEVPVERLGERGTSVRAKEQRSVEGADPAGQGQVLFGEFQSRAGTHEVEQRERSKHTGEPARADAFCMCGVGLEPRLFRVLFNHVGTVPDGGVQRREICAIGRFAFQGMVQWYACVGQGDRVLSEGVTTDEHG